MRGWSWVLQLSCSISKVQLPRGGHLSVPLTPDANCVLHSCLGLSWCVSLTCKEAMSYLVDHFCAGWQAMAGRASLECRPQARPWGRLGWRAAGGRAGPRAEHKVQVWSRTEYLCSLWVMLTLCHRIRQPRVIYGEGAVERMECRVPGHHQP